ncbi:MAG: hypothetical protein RSE41_00545 [Clostridia bacterium]
MGLIRIIKNIFISNLKIRDIRDKLDNNTIISYMSIRNNINKYIEIKKEILKIEDIICYEDDIDLEVIDNMLVDKYEELETLEFKLREDIKKYFNI